MRRLVPAVAVVVALLTGGAAAAASNLPESGFVVYKDLRSYAVTEVRDKATGRVVARTVSVGDESKSGSECGDSRHKLIGAYWHTFRPYLVNVASTPGHIQRAETLTDLKAAHAAWQQPFATSCAAPAGSSAYRALYGGTTKRTTSLVESLARDGANVVAFVSLAGTVCDGGVACVVIDYKGSKINEADFALERDLTRYGYRDFWTTGDETWFDSTGGRFAVSDVATHEWGHFAGLDHVDKSPALTMFPFIHDGMQTLGLGDMKGLLARY